MKRTSTSLIAIGLVSTLAVACAQPADETLVAGGPLGDGGSGAPAASDDPAGVADRAVTDVSAYWTDTFPEVYGGAFEPVAGFHPYGPDTPPPPCGSPPPEYPMIADNAFYCPGDDIIAWDEYGLMPELNREFGAFTVAIVIAHEFGHAIQARAAADDRSVDLELQADCFAGAWTGRVADGDAEGFDPDDVDLDLTVAGMLSIRDAPGSDPDDIYAHGSGFDRVAAFQDGFDNGAATCAGYVDPAVDRPTAQIYDEAVVTGGGDLPLDGPGNIFELVEADLDEYYTWLFDELGAPAWQPLDGIVIAHPAVDEVTCGGDTLGESELRYIAVYCEDENVALIDGSELVDGLYEFGDFAVASELAQIWAAAAQAQLGVDGDEADLQADCLAGLWAASTFPYVRDVTPGSDLGISGGDLDEGIQGFLAYGGSGTRTVFERTDAFRAGVFEGIAGCEQYGPLG